jgi:hypothetical protein
LKLDESSSHFTTFETPFGRMRWLRLPFGVSPAPEIWQARIHAALSGLKGVYCIADDILITGSGSDIATAEHDHDKNLIALLDRCREKGLKLNKEKFRLNRESTSFMGHRLTASGLSPEPQKVEAITQMRIPEDRAGLQRALGMATYLARYCPNYSEITAPLRELTAGENEYRWDDRHTKAFDRLKTMLSSAPVLQYFAPNKHVTVQCDASQAGLGAVLLQDGKVVEYASRMLTQTEKNYAQIEKELLAILFALERFDTYVYARRVTVETDHKPLLAIHKKALAAAPKRLQRMLLRLQRYNYQLVFVRGTDLVLADTLSRAYPPTVTGNTSFTEEIAALATVDTDQLAELQMIASAETITRITNAAKDDDYVRLMNQITAGWPESPDKLESELQAYFTFADELSVSGGLAYKGHRLIVPRPVRTDILERLHSAHTGVNACIRRARETVFWPGITADIKRLTEACHICSRYQQSIQKEPLCSHPAPSRPWEKIGVDIFTFADRDYLCTVDYLSGFYELDRLPSKKVTDIVYCLRQHMARHGLPTEVVTDNSPFNSAEFKRFAERFEFQHTTSSPRYAQSNGKVENAVKTAKRIMIKAREAKTDPFLALLEWRNTPSEQLGPSPAQLMFGRRTRTRLPTANTLLQTTTSNAAATALTDAKIRQAVYYNRGAKDRSRFEVGQTVRVKFDERPEWRKAEIVRVLPFRSYTVRFEDGTTRRRTSKHIRQSGEPPIIVSDDDDGPAILPPLPPPMTTATNTGAPNAKQTQQRSAVQQSLPPAQPQITRSGRNVKPPVRFNDFVQTIVYSN